MQRCLGQLAAVPERGKKTGGLPQACGASRRCRWQGDLFFRSYMGERRVLG